MSRVPVRVVLPAAVLLLAAGACSSTSSPSASAPATSATSAPTTTAPTSTAPSASAAPATPAAPATSAVQIVISNFAFSPMSLTVHPGQTVTVVNNDTTTHTLTSSTGAFDTGAINPGKSATFTAPAKAGSYPYVCSIHASMLGTLTVG